jgi:hypothetical protein
MGQGEEGFADFHLLTNHEPGLVFFLPGPGTSHPTTGNEPMKTSTSRFSHLGTSSNISRIVGESIANARYDSKQQQKRIRKPGKGRLTACLLSLLAGGASASEALAQLPNVAVAVSNQSAPGGGGFSTFSDFSVNNNGNVAFRGGVNGGPGAGIYLFTNSGLSARALLGQSAPGGGTYTSLDGAVLNNAGHVAFDAALNGSPFQGLYLHNGGTTMRAAAGTDSFPGPNNELGDFANPFLNDSGDVAFVTATILPSFYTSTGGQYLVRGLFQGTAPGGGLYNGFSQTPSLNNAGQVAFFANRFSGGTDGIFFHNGTTASQLAFVNGAAPGAAIFTSFNRPHLNNNGQVAFQAGTTSGGGVFLHNGSTLQSRAVFGGSAAGGGSFANFDSVTISDTGTVAFKATTTGGPGSGIYLARSSGISSVALQGSNAPGGGTFASFLDGDTMINSRDQVVFQGITGTAAGIYATDPLGQLVRVARVGDSLAGVAGTVSSLDLNAGLVGNGQIRSFSESGFVVYEAGFSSGGRGLYRADVGNAIVDNSLGAGGTYLLTDGSTRSLYQGKSVVVGQNGSGNLTLTGGSKVITDHASIAQNSGSTGLLTINGSGSQLTVNDGLVVNSGGDIELANTGSLIVNGNTDINGGTIENLANGTVSIGSGVTTTIRNGGKLDLNASALTLDGSRALVVQSNGLFETSGTLSVGNTGRVELDGGRLNLGGMNVNGGQFEFVSGRVNFTASTTLDNTRLELLLGPTRELIAGQTISNSSGTMTVSGNLTVDGGSLLGTTASITNSGTMRVRNGVVNPSVSFTNSSGGLLLVENGAVVNGQSLLSNSGQVQLQGISAELTGGTLSNSGTIRGTGLIRNNLTNNAAGQINVSAGESLVFANSSNSNSGLISAVGGQMTFMSAVTNNNGSGLITARDAIMRFNGGLTNRGSLGVSFGTADIFGDIRNESDGTINVSGGGQVTFYDDLIQNNRFFVTAVGGVTSTAVLFGEFSGAGGFTGGGTVFSFGDLRPGNSPASVLYDGDLFLGSSSGTHIELGGVGAGQFDQILVTGDLGIAGSLFVSLIDGFSLGDNMQFLIGGVDGALSGQFAGLGEGALVGNFGGRDLFISYQAGGGNGISLFTAVPEPGMAGCFAILAIAAVLTRRRRKV